jgi:chaperone required for assembly of F1-ATPase
MSGWRVIAETRAQARARLPLAPLELEATWAAAHVDEDWQMAQWGRDELALAGRDFCFAELRAAATVLRHS